MNKLLRKRTKKNKRTNKTRTNKTRTKKSKRTTKTKKTYNRRIYKKRGGGLEECPVCNELTQCHTTCKDGWHHPLCRDCFRQLRKQECPICREPITGVTCPFPLEQAPFQIDTNEYRLMVWIGRDKINIYFNILANPKAIHYIQQNLLNEIISQPTKWKPERVAYHLSQNVNALEILTDLYGRNPEYINWSELSKNQGAIPLLTANQDNINWNNLSSNPNAIHLLEQNPDKINWSRLSSNPNAIELLSENISNKNIDWCRLSMNPNAIQLLRTEFNKSNNKINPVCLASNPSAIDLINRYINKNGMWDNLASNTNPEAMDILRGRISAVGINNLEKAFLKNLCENPAAFEIIRENITNQYFLSSNCSFLCSNPNPRVIELLRNYQTYIDKDGWGALAKNPAIFV